MHLKYILLQSGTVSFKESHCEAGQLFQGCSYFSHFCSFFLGMVWNTFLQPAFRMANFHYLRVDLIWENKLKVTYNHIWGLGG